ncbi:copper amine oxidase N-terminal domain-containing protein [Cohnella endophytica]|uniref:copper amine oxidase N-terminal domain-containing protein n=1 Tax=Cohnella endophytica TaxID=2419778 RepID=UPI001314CA64|nr:copper amine oxidase N-terminal domain-containing protein [Cohnella endophytica]
MKKTLCALLGITLITSTFLPSHGFADNQPFVIQGKAVHGRTLVPVRAVSAGLGAEVNWNQQSKSITVLKGGTKVLLKIGSNKVMLDGKEITIDVPAQIEHGVSYVPIRFISQTLGGTLTWNASNGTVDVSLDGKQVRVTTESTFNHSNIPQNTVNTLIKQANEATDLSSFPQIRAHFKPYFTDSFMNKLIQQKGLKVNAAFTEISFSYSDDKTGYITQTSTSADNTAYAVERRIVLKYSQNKWLVDDIVFTPLFP